ncbi:MAG: LEA type 2 family protein [Bacteroidales bacterium]|nr:LEA type 2 family protein [Bacteroidales bacterium]MBN2748989.1 LEA type 2 family protein [Bacteroidales bacterium]
MKRLVQIVILISFSLLLSGCGKFKEVNILGLKEVKLRGMKNKVILLDLSLEVQNSNKRRIVISDINFHAWLNDKQLGELRSTNKIVLKADTTQIYSIPVEIELRTMADAFKLMGGNTNALLEQLTVEGYIKGRVFPFTRKIRVEKQPLSQLVEGYKHGFYQ